MEDIKLVAQGYRKILLELGNYFLFFKDNPDAYDGYADSFVDLIKSPEIGFSVSEVETLIKMYQMFGMLTPEDLPSHHAMKIMVNKKVDMNLLESAKTLSVTDFKELVKDEEIGTQERTYTYEVIKRIKETGGIKRVYGEELEEAIKNLKNVA